MAEQDFAHIEAPTPEDVRPLGQLKVLLLTFLALAVVAAGFASGFYVGQEIGMEKASSQSEARLVAELKKQQEELNRLRAEASHHKKSESTTQVGELTFYNELPKQSVEPAPLEASRLVKDRSVDSAASRQEDSLTSEQMLKQLIEQEVRANREGSSQRGDLTGNSRYFLQLASFKKQEEAEAFFPKLNATGYSGEIREIKLADLGIRYRVYAGPFSSKESATSARDELKSRLNITGLIIKSE